MAFWVKLARVSEAYSNDAITADYRILQRKRGHRYSLDDVATAWEAAMAMPAATSYLDLGCGIGSVLLMVTWRLRTARVYGIEALALSAELAEKNVRLNALESRVSIQRGDLRQVTQAWPHQPCELVTGTPPYLPLGTALPSPDPQRAAARIELRGGVEDYLAGAARVLAPHGRVVLCADGRHPERVLEGASAASLQALRRRDIFARPDASQPLFAVWVLAHAGAHAGECERLRMLIRQTDGEQSEEARAMRACFGLGRREGVQTKQGFRPHEGAVNQ